MGQSQQSGIEENKNDRLKENGRRYGETYIYPAPNKPNRNSAQLAAVIALAPVFQAAAECGVSGERQV
jgi:hypothetical protein